MTSTKIASAVSATVFSLLFFTGIAAADSLKEIKFVAIAANDAKATVKKADGSLQVVQPGDVVADTYTVRKIMPGKIVLENRAADGPKTVVVRLEYGRQWLEPVSNNRQRGGNVGPVQDGPPIPATPAPQD